MWSEEKIRAVLDAKRDKLKQEQVKLHDLEEFLYKPIKIDWDNLVGPVTEELREKRADIRKTENQIEVLKYILDSE